MHLIKTLYMLTIIGALLILRLALLKDQVGYEYVNEEYLRPICDDIIVYNFLLTCSSLAFVEKF